MRGRFAALLWLSGCNVVFGLDDPVATDASAVDAPLGRFDEPVPITTTIDIIENDAVLTADEREVLYAVATTTIPNDIVRADVTDGEWGPGEMVMTLSSSVTDAFLRFGRDDQTLFFASDRAGGPGGLDIYRATRADRASPWSTPELVDALSSPAHDRTPAPCANDTRFVLPSDRDGVLTLYEYDPDRANAPVAFVVPLEQPRSPFLTDDCLTLYVTGGALGDLYVLRRDRPVGPWGAPEPLSELNTTDGSESDVWLSDDGRHIVFSRDGDIWEAFR